MAPNNQHCIVEHLFDVVRTPQIALQEARQPWKVGQVQRLKGGPITQPDPLEQCSFGQICIARPVVFCCQVRFLTV